MKRLFLFLLLINPFFLNAQLKINEIMTNNVSYNMDDAYNYSMWVEVYNFSVGSVNQTDFYFSDESVNLAKWKPTSKTIISNGYALLWFERDERPGHATFKLDPEGGKLYLSNSSGLLLDSVAYPKQYRNISYGRKTDGTNLWTFFEQPSPGASNNNKLSSSQRCPVPVFSLKNGFYTDAQNFRFMNPAVGDTIYFTKDGSEPTRGSFRYSSGATIPLTATTILRAKTFSLGKLSSDVVTSTYFINQRVPDLPVVSIVTNQANLNDNIIGIYVNGTNGITGNGQTQPRNFNQDWDRPVNFEFFDTTGVSRLNQEVDIKILGGWTRSNGLKSIAISPKKKHGDNQLRYDFFAATKPNRKYKDIQMRNSGNDFRGTMMRDAFIQSIIMHRMDLDYLAYEPAVLFINGAYYGIENLRERSSSDYMFSNYGLEDDKITLIEATNLGVNTDKDMATDAGLAELNNFAKNNDVTDPAIYNQLSEKLDIDEYINYMIAQIYIANTDWPYNNVKMWKVTDNGKWRWIYFDTDFGFDSGRTGHNSLTFALAENSSGIIGGYSIAPEWSSILFKRLVLNQNFLNKFIDRFAIHISTTYETKRVNRIMDSLSVKIASEMPYFYTRWGGSMNNFTNGLNGMKTFSAGRPANMLKFLSARFLNAVPVQTLKISSNVPGSTYSLNNEQIIDSEVSLKYFKYRDINLKANPVSGYKFKHWTLLNSVSITLLPMGSTWKYFDGSAVPAVDWHSKTYNDSSWLSGAAPLGYGDAGNATTIGYGGNASNKYITSYFRKTVNISDLSSSNSFIITPYVDDGAVVYVNGHEVGRVNMPNVTMNFNTLASSSNEGLEASFSVPITYLNEGENIIAVEVHQSNYNSSDLVFNLQMTYSPTDIDSNNYPDPVFSGSLTADFDFIAVYEKTNEEPIEENTVFINEIVASNNVIEDEYGGNDDYIEIYNSGDETINLAGWYLSDTPANKTLFQIPSTNLAKTSVPAKGRLILWADDETGQGVLHVGFKLSKDGETLILSRRNNSNQLVTVDSVSYPFMGTNMSYSRLPDGGINWVIQATTHNLSNLILDLEEMQQNPVNIYPTLVSESFTVLNASGKGIVITDLTGKALYRSVCQSDNETIYTSDFKKGMYLVTVGHRTIKIVKK